MSEKPKAFAVTALILLIGLAGWAGCSSFGPRDTLADDDERPPIVVYESSIHFANGYGWTDQNGDKKVWRPTQPNGKHLKHYDVVVTTTTSKASCPNMSGKTIEINYESRTFKLLTKPHAGGKKDEPELESPDALDLDTSGLILDFAEGGKIKKIKVGSSECDTSGMAGIKITATPKH